MNTTIETPELLQKIEYLTARAEEQDLLIAKLQTLVKYYESQLLMLKRSQYGVSSEKYSVDSDEYRQMGLFNKPEDTAEIPAPPPETEEVAYTRKKRKGKREEDLSGLPVVRVEHELPEDERLCPKCGGVMQDMGVDVRRTLELIPAQVVVKEDAIHAYVCEECRENAAITPIIKASAPAPLIAGSLASPSLVAHIVTQKYMNATPLYRLEKGFIFDGISVSRQTMANWVIKCVELYLFAIYGLLIKFLVKEQFLHADETTTQVLHEPGRPAQSKSFEWVYRTSGCAEHPIVIYEYQPTRKQEHPALFLKGFQGFLHTDGYQGYHNLPEGIIVVGCWAHARRKWEHSLKSLPEGQRKGSDAERGVLYISALFALEREFKNMPHEERNQKRLEKSKPISDAFFAWVQSLGALPKSALGEAVGYSLSQREYLENVFLDGRTELSNNRAERSVKTYVLGRKNWMFSNTQSGANASSVMYSIVGTASENGLHPFQYLKFLLEALPNATSSELENFLPWSKSLPDYCYVPAKKI